MQVDEKVYQRTAELTHSEAKQQYDAPIVIDAVKPGMRPTAAEKAAKLAELNDPNRQGILTPEMLVRNGIQQFVKDAHTKPVHNPKHIFTQRAIGYGVEVKDRPHCISCYMVLPPGKPNRKCANCRNERWRGLEVLDWNNKEFNLPRGMLYDADSKPIDLPVCRANLVTGEVTYHDLTEEGHPQTVIVEWKDKEGNDVMESRMARPMDLRVAIVQGDVVREEVKKITIDCPAPLTFKPEV